MIWLNWKVCNSFSHKASTDRLWVNKLHEKCGEIFSKVYRIFFNNYYSRCSWWRIWSWQVYIVDTLKHNYVWSCVHMSVRMTKCVWQAVLVTSVFLLIPASWNRMIMETRNWLIVPVSVSGFLLYQCQLLRMFVV